jgi:hypothetical protein
MGAIGPRGEAGHDIELFEERADDLISVGATAKVIELAHDASEGSLDVGDGVFRVVRSVLL